MYRIAILGCENTHAAGFLKAMKEEGIDDVEVVGVYSHQPEAAEKLNADFGVPVLDNYDSAVGKVDGVIITARHGDRHYMYAKPYISSGIPMFIDKPITIKESEACEFVTLLKENGCRITGGSMCIYSDYVQELKAMKASGEYGNVLGGYLRAPLMSGSEHGGFYFYSHHLVHVMCELFGYYPNSVIAHRCGDAVNITVRYDGYDVNAVYADNSASNNVYYAGINFEKKVAADNCGLNNCASRELHTYLDLLRGGDMKLSYSDVFAPVYILAAIDRAMQSGKEEIINRGPAL